MASIRWLITAILLLLTVFFTVQTARIWLQPLESNAALKAPTKPEQADSRSAARHRQTPLSAYNVIADQNLFAPDRSKAVSDADLSDLKNAQTSRYARTLTLEGVVINNGEKSALVYQDKRRRGTDEMRWVRIGDSIDQITIVGIESDRILVQEGGSTYEILLSKRRRSEQRTKKVGKEGPRVISTEGKTAPSPAPPPPDRAKPEKETPEKAD